MTQKENKTENNASPANIATGQELKIITNDNNLGHGTYQLTKDKNPNTLDRWIP
jgi:hypothetical protein